MHIRPNWQLASPSSPFTHNMLYPWQPHNTSLFSLHAHTADMLGQHTYTHTMIAEEKCLINIIAKWHIKCDTSSLCVISAIWLPCMYASSNLCLLRMYLGVMHQNLLTVGPSQCCCWEVTARVVEETIQVNKVDGRTRDRHAVYPQGIPRSHMDDVTTSITACQDRAPMWSCQSLLTAPNTVYSTCSICSTYSLR